MNATKHLGAPRILSDFGAIPKRFFSASAGAFVGPIERARRSGPRSDLTTRRAACLARTARSPGARHAAVRRGAASRRARRRRRTCWSGGTVPRAGGPIAARAAR